MVLFRTVPAFRAPLIGSSSDNRSATLPNGDQRRIPRRHIGEFGRHGRGLEVEGGEALPSPCPDRDRRAGAEPGLARRRTASGTSRCNVPCWPARCPQATHVRRRSPAIVTCAGTISAWIAAVSRFASARRSPRSARPACSSRSMRATSTSVVSPASNSVTSLTRHTNFVTSSPSPREPKTYRNRNKPHRFACSRSLSRAAASADDH